MLQAAILNPAPVQKQKLVLPRGSTERTFPSVKCLAPSMCRDLCRAKRRRKVDVYAWPLNHRLPTIPIPLATDDREVSLDGSAIEPTLTWGTTPEEALPVSGVVPDPASFSDPNKRAHAESALRYMDLKPGTPLTDIKIDRVFIGTCTNGRIDDLRAAAAVLKGRKVKVQGWVSPGSTRVKRDAEAEGLDKVFEAAGLEWRASGCSGCAAMNGDDVPAGMRAASTSNRNFEGRQGAGGRTHLVSPAMAAAAAIHGHFVDIRRFV